MQGAMRTHTVFFLTTFFSLGCMVGMYAVDSSLQTSFLSAPSALVFSSTYNVTVSVLNSAGHITASGITIPFTDIFSLKTLGWKAGTITAAPYYYLSTVTCCDATGAPLMKNNKPVTVPVFLALAYDAKHGWVDVSNVAAKQGNKLEKSWTNDPAVSPVTVDTMLRVFTCDVVTNATPVAALGGSVLTCWPVLAVDVCILKNPKTYFTSQTTLNGAFVQMTANTYAVPGGQAVPSSSWTIPNPLDASIKASSTTTAVTFPVAGGTPITYNVPTSSVYDAVAIPNAAQSGAALPVVQTYITTLPSTPAGSYLSFVTDQMAMTLSPLYLNLNPSAPPAQQVWIALLSGSAGGALVTASGITLDATGKNVVVSGCCCFDQQSNGASAQLCALSCQGFSSYGTTAQKACIASKIAGSPSQADWTQAGKDRLCTVSGVVAASGAFFQGQVLPYLQQRTVGLPAFANQSVYYQACFLQAFFGASMHPALLYANLTGILPGYCSVQAPSADLQKIVQSWNGAKSGALIRMALTNSSKSATSGGVLVLSPDANPFTPYYGTFLSQCCLLVIDANNAVSKVPLDLSGTAYTTAVPIPVGAGALSDEQLLLLVHSKVTELWSKPHTSWWEEAGDTFLAGFAAVGTGLAVVGTGLVTGVTFVAKETGAVVGDGIRLAGKGIDYGMHAVGAGADVGLKAAGKGVGYVVGGGINLVGDAVGSVIQDTDIPGSHLIGAGIKGAGSLAGTVAKDASSIAGEGLGAAAQVTTSGIGSIFRGLGKWFSNLL